MSRPAHSSQPPHLQTRLKPLTLAACPSLAVCDCPDFNHSPRQGAAAAPSLLCPSLGGRPYIVLDLPPVTGTDH